MAHATRLEADIRDNHYKSIEIIQALLLLASWTEVPSTVCRDRTWLYVSHAIALAEEVRLTHHYRIACNLIRCTMRRITMS